MIGLTEETLHQVRYGGNPRHIAGEDEEADKGEKKCVVHVLQRLGLQHHQCGGNHDQAQPVGNASEHHQNGYGKENQVRGQPSHGHFGLFAGEADGIFGKGQTAERDHEHCQNEGRKHGDHELPVPDSEIGVQVEVLGIAEGGEHTAQVGCDVLKNEYICHISLIAGAVQDDVAQRKEGEQCHVIGDEHGTDEGDVHQGNGGKTEVLCEAYDLFRTDIEETDLPEGADHGKGTEKAGQGTEVKVAEIRGVRRYDDGRDQGENGGNGKNDISADKSGDCVKYNGI